MILMPQIFDVIANENARYKRNELECDIIIEIKVAFLPTLSFRSDSLQMATSDWTLLALEELMVT